MGRDKSVCSMSLLVEKKLQKKDLHAPILRYTHIDMLHLDRVRWDWFRVTLSRLLSYGRGLCGWVGVCVGVCIGES